MGVDVLLSLLMRVCLFAGIVVVRRGGSSSICVQGKQTNRQAYMQVNGQIDSQGRDICL